MPLKKVPFTDARETLSALIDEVQRSGQPIAITRHGKPVAALMNMEAVEQKLASRGKREWMLRGSGAWAGESADLDTAIGDLRKRLRLAKEKRLKHLSRELSDK